MNNKQIIEMLYDIGAIKLGHFTLASGMKSSLYIDLRQIVSYPTLLKNIANTLWQQLQSHHADLICGVPYTALPIATAISLQEHLPMIMVRKEAKTYGTKKMIEGAFESGQTCFLIEDLVTTGGSVMKAAKTLEAENLKIQHMAVLIDREQGGRKNLEDAGYQLHAAMTITEVIHTLQELNKLSKEENTLAEKFLGTLKSSC